MKFFVLAALLSGSIAANASAANIRDVKLTDACETSLKDFAIRAETDLLSAMGETLASKLEAEVYLSYWPLKEDVAIGVNVEDKADGRYVRYRASVLKSDAMSCRITLERATKSACRYSSADGIDGLLSIPAMSYLKGEKITPETKLTSLQSDQIRAFLGGNGLEGSVKEMITDTDDGYLTTGTLTLPSGKKLAYYGAYGGDNPFGIFFKQGSTIVAGDNSDGSICLNY